MSASQNMEEAVSVSCHYALQVAVENLKNRCQIYRERIKILENEKAQSEKALFTALQDNANLRRKLCEEELLEKPETLDQFPDSVLLGEPIRANEQSGQDGAGSSDTDSSSSVELISGSSSSSSVESIISQEELTIVEPCPTINEIPDEEQAALLLQRALAQLLENKRALNRQMELIEELGVAMNSVRITACPLRSSSDYSSLESFEIVVPGNH